MRVRNSGGSIATGDPNATDCMTDFEWRRHTKPAALYDTWGSPQTSPWSAFHRPTLFASLDGFHENHLGPAPVANLDASGAPRTLPRWADERAAILLDLPGPASVAFAGWIVRHGRHEPVATFNNWPHARGLVPAHQTIGALLHFSPWAQEGRARRDPQGRYPPVLMLDAQRMGKRKANVGEFDNRYFLLESDLPSGPTLRRLGIERVVHVAQERREADDLNRYLYDVSRHVRIESSTLGEEAWSLTMPAPYTPELRKTPYSTASDPAFRGFKRNAVGGFGKLVPERSSGGGG